MFPSRWRTSGYHRRSLLKGIGSQRPSCGRKAHCESRSPTREVAGDQLAAHRRDQVHRDRQPESGSLSRGLGGEKGLEQTLQNFRGNARSVVLHVDDNLLILASPSNANRSLSLDRMGGVDQQVDQNLRKRAGPYQPNAGLRQRRDFHRSSGSTSRTTQIQQSMNDQVDSLHFRVDPIEIFFELLGRAQPAASQGEVAQNAAERVSYFVCHPGGQLPDRREPRGRTQLGLSAGQPFIGGGEL